MAAGTPAEREAPPLPFSIEDVRRHVQKNAEALRAAGHGDLAESLERLNLEELYRDLEQLEQRLTAIEEKMTARPRAAATEEALFEARRTLDQELKPYRGKMSAAQLATLGAPVSGSEGPGIGRSAAAEPVLYVGIGPNAD